MVERLRQTKIPIQTTTHHSTTGIVDPSIRYHDPGFPVVGNQGEHGYQEVVDFMGPVQPRLCPFYRGWARQEWFVPWFAQMHPSILCWESQTPM